ncbi:MAG TPA: von Willebrand factor type A domain-containing protein, partial [Gemmatimonadales bacterium]|nr:von Willebrand factor type A domain-containing protein [Gemmatimonadales bacterium]
MRLAALVVATLSLARPAPTPQPATGTIEGTIRSRDGGTVPGARVSVVGTRSWGTSARDGRYRIVNVPAGRVTLRVEMPGFLAASVSGVEVTPGRTVVRDIVLSPLAAKKVEGDVAASPHVANEAHRQEWRGTVQWLAPASPSGGFNTEDYRHFRDNRFLTVAANPLSTFAIDVDAASYANVRRFLKQGQLPPADAVRVEELINYFPYDYPAPRDEHPFSVTTAQMPAPWARDHRLVMVGIQGRRIEAAALPPSNLVFLLDVSGSMMSEDKLPLVKSAFRLLVQQLRPQDRVAMVVYAGAAGLVLPPTSGA